MINQEQPALFPEIVATRDPVKEEQVRLITNRALAAFADELPARTGPQGEVLISGEAWQVVFIDRSEHMMACYESWLSKITFVREYLNREDLHDLRETIAHEVGHAITKEYGHGPTHARNTERVFAWIEENDAAI